MAIKRTAVCSVCGLEETEDNFGDGWMNWGAVNGINFNGDTNPMLCPEHLSMVANFMDKLKDIEGGSDAVE